MPKAKVGSVDVRSSEGIKLALDLIIPHPRYRRSQNYNDIALVSLRTPLRSSSLVRPVCLQTRPLVKSRINTNTSFMVIGFGGTETNERSETLMKSANLEWVQGAKLAGFLFSNKKKKQNFVRMRIRPKAKISNLWFFFLFWQIGTDDNMQRFLYAFQQTSTWYRRYSDLCCGQ